MAGVTQAGAPTAAKGGGSSVTWASSTSIVDLSANGSRPGSH